MIAVSCAQCGKNIKVKDELAGKKVKCPQCGQAVRIPSVAAAPEPVSAAAKSKTVPPRPAADATRPARKTLSADQSRSEAGSPACG